MIGSTLLTILAAPGCDVRFGSFAAARSVEPRGALPPKAAATFVDRRVRFGPNADMAASGTNVRLARLESNVEDELQTFTRSADSSHLSTTFAAAEEAVAAIGLQPRHAYSRWHFDCLQHLPGLRIDPPQIALVPFQSGMPEFPIDPCDARDKAVGFDGAKDDARFRVDLMDLAGSVLPHPEGPFGPRQPRVTAAAGCRDCGEHLAGRWIDLLDAILGELKQVPAVEGRSCMRGDIDRALHLPARRIEGVQLVSSGKPNVLTVIGHSSHVVGTWKGPILTDDFGG